MKLKTARIAVFLAATIFSANAISVGTTALAAESTIEPILVADTSVENNDEIVFERTKAWIEVGENAEINIISGPTNVVWDSSNTEVLTVREGVVTGIGEGTAIITATSLSGATASCTVTVVRPEDVDAYIHPIIFNDVSTDAYYYIPVMWAYENDVTAGTSANTFSPNKICTRCQMVQFLWNAYGNKNEVTNSTLMPFTDVKRNMWYSTAVMWACENGITAGTSKNTFSPNAKCTRAQAVTFIWNAMSKPDPKGDPRTFSDVDDSAWYATAVRWAADYEITAGTGAGKFSPNKTCSRAEIVSFLYRASIIDETHRPEGGY